MNAENVTLPAEAIPAIRRMLTVGLHAYGECSRVQQEARAAESMGQTVDPHLIPIGLSGDYETANFAVALNWLEFAEDVGATQDEESQGGPP